MTPEVVVDIARNTMEATLLLMAPILAIAMLVSLVINVVQVLTSVQEPTISTVPRLLATGVAVFLMTPWMVRRMTVFTVGMLSDLRPYLR
jgi:flagellar biosynthesis protein FliQ